MKNGRRRWATAEWALRVRGIGGGSRACPRCTRSAKRSRSDDRSQQEAGKDQEREHGQPGRIAQRFTRIGGKDGLSSFNRPHGNSPRGLVLPDCSRTFVAESRTNSEQM